MSILRIQLENVVKAQVAYIEKHGITIDREIRKQIDIDIPKALIITGVRRSGKSTLLRNIYQQLHKSVGYLHFDDPRLYDFEVQDFYTLEELWAEKEYYQFDEIQKIASWEVYIRQAIERKKKIAITGSNAQLLSKELGTHLTGRHISYELFPFSYEEYLELSEQSKSHDSYKNYIKQGGFPEPLIYPMPTYHNELFNDIIQRDIAVRFGVRNLGDLMHIALHLINNLARPFSYRKLANSYGIKSANTVGDYVRMLQDTYLLFTIPKFSYSARKQLVNNKKAYIIDHAFARENSTQLHEDHGRILENMLFIHLRRQYKNISYFQGEGECDFVVNTSNGIELYQVCFEVNRSNYDREINGLTEAIIFFKLKSGKIITDNQSDSIVLDSGLKIDLIPYWILTSKE